MFTTIIKQIWISVMLVTVVACGQTSLNKNPNNSQLGPFKLKLKPLMDSKYHYETAIETETNMVINRQDAKHTYRTAISVNYNFLKDSSGSLLFSAQFDNINIYTKNRDDVQEMNADDKTSTNPLVRFLGIVKETPFRSALSSGGDIKIITGSKELGNKALAAFPATDTAAWRLIESEWPKLFGQDFIKENFARIYHFAPDTSLHVGSSWISITQGQELPITIYNKLTLKSVKEGIALIECTGTIEDTNRAADIKGVGDNIICDLKGEQHGAYEIDIETGMLTKSLINTNISGTMEQNGKVVPTKIKSSVNIIGKKLNS